MVEVAAGDGTADERRRHNTAVPGGNRAHDLDAESSLVAERAHDVDVAFPAPAETVVVADDEVFDVEAMAQDFVHELRGAVALEHGREGDDRHVSHTALGDDFELF